MQTNHTDQPEKTRAEITKGRLDLERQVAARLKRPQTEVSEIVLAFLNEVGRELAKGMRIELRKFGRFEVRDHKPRVVANPHTGEPIEVPGRKAVNFRAGTALTNVVQPGVTS